MIIRKISFIYLYLILIRNVIVLGDEVIVYILCRFRSLVMCSNYVIVYCIINLLMLLIFRI